MRSIILIAAVPLALTACKLGDTDGANTSASVNTSTPAAVPDSIEVNGVTYVRAGLDKIPPAAATPAPAPTSDSLSPPPSDSGDSVPPNTGSGGTAADHGE